MAIITNGLLLFHLYHFSLFAYTANHFLSWIFEFAVYCKILHAKAQLYYLIGGGTGVEYEVNGLGP